MVDALGLVRSLAPTTVSGLIAYLVVAAIVAFLYSIRAKTLPGLPTAPGFLPFFGVYFQLQANRHRLYDWIADMANGQFRGKPFQFSIPGGPPMIQAPPSEAITRLLLKDHFVNWTVSKRRREWTEELFGQGIFGSNGELWMRQRKAASNIFTLRLLRDGMTPVFMEHGEVFLQLLKDAALARKPVDLQDVFFRYTMDSFCQIAFGEDVGCLKQANPHPFARSFDLVQSRAMNRVVDVAWKIKRALNIGSEREVKEHTAVINEYARLFIAHRRQDIADGKHREDLISHFMQQAKKEGRTLTDVELRDVIVNFLVAGRDTTAVAMSWFFHEMTQNPEALKKVRAEVDALMQVGLERGVKNVADFEVARDMRYTEAALLETLRLHPSVAAEARMNTEADALPDGTPLPPNTAVAYNPYTYGRSPELWGEDVLQYKPERWLDEKGGTGDHKSSGVSGPGVGTGTVEFNDSTLLQKHNMWKYPTFNAGMRLCMGRGLALLEAKLLIASILHNFDLALTPDHPKVTYQLTVTLMLKDGLKMTPSLRANRLTA